MKEADLEFWTGLVSKGTMNATANLSQFVGQEITVASFGLRRIPVAETSQLMGGPESESVAIYLTISGSADGHIMLLYDPQMAYQFVDMLMGQPPGTTETLGEMEESALAELGNIVGSGFLNALADATGLTLLPSPPTVMKDMTGGAAGHYRGGYPVHAGRRLCGANGLPWPGPRLRRAVLCDPDPESAAGHA